MTMYKRGPFAVIIKCPSDADFTTMVIEFATQTEAKEFMEHHAADDDAYKFELAAVRAPSAFKMFKSW